MIKDEILKPSYNGTMLGDGNRKLLGTTRGRMNKTSLGLSSDQKLRLKSHLKTKTQAIGVAEFEDNK